MIIVLLSTYNGERYLQEQLESLLQQNNVDIKILVRDDGSTDNTISILNKWQNKGLLSWYSGENLGPAYSFFDLIYKTSDAEFYAFCDQDDVWLPDKLRIAVESLDSEKPALYFSQTQMVNENLQLIHTPSLSPKVIFEEAIVNYYVTGCTVVFNHKLLCLLKEYRPSFLAMHDLWSYLVCLSVDGKIIYDSHSHILYRQHSNNAIGLRRNFWKEWKRRFIKTLLKNERIRSKTICEILQGYKSYLSPEKLELLETIRDYRLDLKSYFKLLFNRNIKPLNWKKDVLFRIAVLLKKF